MNEARKNIDDCLSIRNGCLYIEECNSVELVRQFGSPIFVVSENQLRRNIRKYQKAFEDRWPEGKVNILPAVKANYILALQHILSREGSGFDVYSSGELDAVLQSGVEPELVSVNGSDKSEEFIRKSINAEVKITIDNVYDIDTVEKIANELDKKVKVRLRLRPDFPNLWQPTGFAHEKVPIDLCVQVYRCGIPKEQIVSLGSRALNMKNIEVTGLHIHLGRNHRSVKYWKETIKSYVKLIAELKEAWGGWVPGEIDVGGGIPIPRDPFGKLINKANEVMLAILWLAMLFLRIFGEKIRYKIISSILDRFVGHKPKEVLAPAIEEYAEGITGTMRRELIRHGIDPGGITLQLEPGRSMYGNAGIHLSTVTKVKHQTEPIKWNWVMLDTTYFFMTYGVFENSCHSFIFANKADQKPVKVADIVGRSCAADRIIPEARIPEVQEGDTIAILDTGAYQEASSCNFNAIKRPATVLVNGDSAEIIKHAETQEDVFRRDVIPERFVKK